LEIIINVNSQKEYRNKILYLFNKGMDQQHDITTKQDRSVSLNEEMYVTKRDGKREIVSFDKILNRIKKIGQEGNMKLNYTALVMKVIDQLYDGISTTKIDELSAEQCASMASIHPDYNVLAGSIIISNHHRNTTESFLTVMSQLYNFKDKHGKHSPLISEATCRTVQQNPILLNDMCDYSRDYLIDYFGYKTLERAYLMRIDGKIVERVQHMWMRVAIGIHGDNLTRVKETYDLMSQKYFTHATPTLFNAGTPRPQLSSCFLLSMESDSIEGIYNTLKDCASISKWAGGIGLHIHNVRASGSHIRGTNGSSNGIVPMLKVFNNTAKYVDQCLDPDTIVYTKRGAIPIKNIVIGDEVITDDGNFYEIGKVLDSHYEGDFYTLKVQDSIKLLKLTDMHPLWCIQNPENQDSYHIYNMLEKKMIAPDFIEVKNINTNDYIGFPIPKYEKDIREYTEDDCRFYGIYFNSLINDNALIDSTGKDPIIKLYITNSKKDTIQFIENYLSSYSIPFNKDENNVNGLTTLNGLTTFEWKRINRFKFTYEMFYKGIPALMHLPQPKILKLIRGMIELNNSTINGDYFIYYYNTIKSKNLTSHLRYMLLRLGILTSGNDNVLRISMTDLNKILQIDVTVPPQPNDYFEYNGTLFSRVINNSFVANYSGRVIDIEVNNADHHNFLTDSGLVKNGGGKRNGSFAIYLEPWHADVELFLQMRKNHGDEELKARDLFYALWVPDLFMDRIKADGQWTLMCPDECPGLSDVYGDAFVELYTRYEREGKGRTTVKARDLWFQVLDAQMETGTPYLVYKDAANKKSNQQNVGTIKSSNLCSEIIEYSDANETAVCNLASLALPTFIDSKTDPEHPTIDYAKLHAVTKVVTYNLNKIIDINYYPTEKTRRSNMRHRPIGIGIQGLADVFMMLNLPFTSDEAKKVNHRIFETIYHGAVEQSCEMAKELGPYETFVGSPASKGQLQFDLWNVSPTLVGEESRYDWTALKERVVRDGLYNSLLLAPMPTASTSQILGNNECIEPITSNIYNRRTIAGEFILANKYLMKDLLKLDLWNEKVKNNIIANNGSVQHIEAIPPEIREKYKTVWEIPMRTLIDMAADRGAFVCQSQSLNLWLEDPNYSMLTSMHFYAWSKGLKTGIYYLRRRGRHQAQQFTIEPEKRDTGTHIYEEDEVCEMCSA
jgi:ribonucleoside-diphosphate reductase alpha subunit